MIAKDRKLFKNIGIVTSLSDGIVRIAGIYDVGYNETIDIGTEYN
jgi:F0F1-type ATP synthase alpha subunit